MLYSRDSAGFRRVLLTGYHFARQRVERGSTHIHAESAHLRAWRGYLSGGASIGKNKSHPRHRRCAKNTTSVHFASDLTH